MEKTSSQGRNTKKQRPVLHTTEPKSSNISSAVGKHFSMGKSSAALGQFKDGGLLGASLTNKKHISTRALHTVTLVSKAFKWS